MSFNKLNNEKEKHSEASNKIFKQLAKNNVKKSIKDYAIYFMTLAFGIVLLYTFNSLDDNLKLLSGNNLFDPYLGMVRGIMIGFSIIICIIFGFLVAYANNFIMRKRKREFGIYITLGMSKKNINKLMFKEMLIIGIGSLIIGVFLGVFASQGLSMIASSMLGLTTAAFKFHISTVAIIKTVIFYVLILFLVNKLNEKNIAKYKVIDLINASKSNEKVISNNNFIKIITFFISLILMGIAYLILPIPADKLLIAKYVFCAILIILGTFLFFISISDFVTNMIRRCKKVYYKNLNMYTLNQMSSRIKTTSSSMTAICILLFLAMLIVPFGFTASKEMVKDLDTATPYDATLIRYDINPDISMESKKISNNFVSFKNQLIKSNLPIEKLVANMSEVKIYRLKDVNLYSLIGNRNSTQGNNHELEIIGLSDYNSARIQQGLNSIQLNNNEFVINCDISNFKLLKDYLKGEDNSIKINGSTLKLAQKKNYNVNYRTKQLVEEHYTIVVPDKVVSNLEPVRTYLNFNYRELNNYYDNEFWNIYTDFRDSHKNYNYSVNSKLVIDGEKVAYNTMFSFIAIYLGVILLVTAGAILALQQISESATNKERVNLLRKLGVEESKINYSILVQVVMLFAIPLVLAIIHTTIASAVLYGQDMELTSAGITNNTLITAVIVALIYGIYLFLSYVETKNIINGKKSI